MFKEDGRTGPSTNNYNYTVYNPTSVTFRLSRLSGKISSLPRLRKVVFQIEGHHNF